MENKIHFLGKPRDKNSLILSTIAVDINGKRDLFDPGKGMYRPTEDSDTQTYGHDTAAVQDGKKFDRVFLTHGHLDHIGNLCALSRAGFFHGNTQIWGSPQTNEIVRITGFDDLRKRDCEFDIFDYIGVISRLRNIPHPGENIIDGDKICADPNGHMGGSTSFTITTPSGNNILICGDTCRHDQAIVLGGLKPTRIIDEIWTTDLTYPLNEEADMSYDDKRLKLIVAAKEYLSKGKTVVIQGFASVKIPNIAHDLAAAGISVWVDSSMAWKILNIYHKIQWSDKDVPVSEARFENGINKVKGRKHRQELMEDGQPKVILATGGMGDFGPILNWYEYGLPLDNFVFCTTSWLAPGSNGLRLVESAGKEMVKLKFKDGFREIQRRAEVKQFSLSSHGTLGDFIIFLMELVAARDGKKLKRIFLTHGTAEAMKKVEDALKQFAEEVIPGYLIGEAQIV